MGKDFPPNVNRPLHNTARNFIDGCCSSRCLHIFVEQLVCRGPGIFTCARGLGVRGFSWLVFLGCLGLGYLGPGFRGHHRGNRLGLDVAAMAGIAGHGTMTLEVVLVDGKHHFHHFARGLLVFLVVLFERILHVAELAFHAQRSCNELHGGKDLVRGNSLQNFDVLELFLGLFRSG